MITADQLVAHALGDYVFQSHWMAQHKTSRWLPALAHAATYGLAFILMASPAALAVIVVTHLLIDRFRLAKYAVWAKNLIAPAMPGPLTTTGYPAGVPDWLAVWLMIAADNTIHVLVNGAAMSLWPR